MPRYSDSWQSDSFETYRFSSFSQKFRAKVNIVNYLSDIYIFRENVSLKMSQEVLLKQIRIKTGVVKRITREKQSYEKETENEQKRLLKFKDNGMHNTNFM